MIIELNRFELVRSIPVAPTYAKYPRIYQRHLIPDEVFNVLNARWDQPRAELPPVTLHKARQVFVAAEGLVFTKSGAVVAQTRLAHSESDIATARGQLEEMLTGRVPIQSHARGVLCKKRGAENYGHWLVEMLPKAFWARKELGIDDWPVVVHETSGAMQRVVRESLEAIGVPAQQILATGREPVYFEELVIVEGLTSHAFFISPRVLECMEAISAKASTGGAASLYAVRRPAISRDFEDEPEIAKVLHADGYTEIETGELPFLEQVAAFKTARRVTGPMGAALTNIIFCQPGTEVLVFMPASALELFFWLIAEAKKLDYHEVRCEEAGENLGALPWNRAQRISAPAVRLLLERLSDVRRVAAIDLKNAEKWPSAFVLSAQDIVGRRWLWRFSHIPDVIHEVTFAADGTIRGYVHQNEAAWRIVGEALEIITIDGRCSWRFIDISESPQHIRLCGSFQLNADIKTILYLTEMSRSAS